MRLTQAVPKADVGHVGTIQGIHSEPFFSVGVGDGVAFVPASYLDVRYADDPTAAVGDGWDNDAGENDAGVMDDDPVGVGDADPNARPATAAVQPPQVVQAMFLDWRKRNRR